jgi:hypothetical protein
MQLDRSRPHLPRYCVATALVALLLAVPSGALAAPITLRSGSGADAASIQAVVELFRGDLGGLNNGNTLGSVGSGRREINWDGGGAGAPATTFPVPMVTFNSLPTTRGAEFTTPGTGFEISGQLLPEFGEINATYPAIFQTFSAPRLFAPLGSTITDVLFFEPGSSTPATVTGFGAVFTDVDLANTSSLEFFNDANQSLGVFFVPTANNGLSFLGLTFAEQILRVRITSGNTALGPNETSSIDVVALDDFIYSEPLPVPEPTTLALFGLGLGALAARLRRKLR